MLRMAGEAEVFAATLRELRERSGLTQEKLAHAAGLTTNYLSDVERGRKVPSLTTVLQLAHGLGCAPGDLLARFTPAVLKRLFS
jgi:transcriptional regulator with XRE-family HTH domain